MSNKTLDAYVEINIDSLLENVLYLGILRQIDVSYYLLFDQLSYQYQFIILYTECLIILYLFQI